jgi:hypothetical protein
VCPSVLVQTDTVMVLSVFCWYPAATSAPDALTATDPPHPAAGNWTGGDHVLAACAGSATAVP